MDPNQNSQALRVQHVTRFAPYVRVQNYCCRSRTLVECLFTLSSRQKCFAVSAPTGH